MKVFEVTAVTKTGDYAITTSCGTLIFQSSLAMSALTNEAISLWIERQGAQNVYLANRTPLKDVVYCLLTENQRSIQKGIAGGNQVVLDFGIESAIKLSQGERLMVSLENLKTAQTYIMHSLEDHEESLGYKAFETKSVLVGQREVEFETLGSTVAVIKNDNSVSQIGITRLGKERRFTPYELQSLIIEESPILIFNSTGGIDQTDTNYLLLPLFDITKLKFYTDGSAAIPMTFMRHDELLPVSNSKYGTIASKKGI